MLSTRIYNKIFKADSISQDLGSVYARTGQDDVGLEWVGLRSQRIGCLLAYLRVTQNAEDACLFFNGEIGAYLESLSQMNRFPDVDEDVVTNETILALHYILEVDPSGEDNLCMALYEEIRKTPVADDACFLVALNHLL